VLLRDKFLKLPHGNANIKLLATRHAKDIICIMYLTYIECLFIEKLLSHYKERTSSLLRTNTEVSYISSPPTQNFVNTAAPVLRSQRIKRIAAIDSTITRLTRIRNAPAFDVNRIGTILAGILDFPRSFQTNDEIILGK